MEEVRPAESRKVRNVMLVRELKSGPLRERGKQYALREAGEEIRRSKDTVDTRAGKLGGVGGRGNGCNANAGEGGRERSAVRGKKMRIACFVGVMVFLQVRGKGRKNGTGLPREAGGIPTVSVTRTSLSVSWVGCLIGVHRGEHIGEGCEVSNDARMMAGRVCA